MKTPDEIDRPRMAKNKPHGTRLKYQGGCRCLVCRAANARYALERLRARSSGDRNGLVRAEVARRHILRLSRQGVGRQAIAAASDVAESVIFRVRSRRQSHIQKRTEDKILSVSDQALSDAALVRARGTWRQINGLLSEGFTKAELARRLGYKSGSLQFGKLRVLARTAARVDRFFRLQMKE